jgi:phosphate transport system substrate-binding protein
MRRKIVAIVLTLVIAMSMLPIGTAFASGSGITLIIDGARQNPTVPPRVVNGVTMVPLRLISESLGAQVAWNGTARTATIETAAYTVVFTINSRTYTVNGASRQLTEAAQLVAGSTLVPIRAFAESIGADVNYDATTNTATINYFTTVSGTVRISGSTTLQPVVQAAADRIRSKNSNLSIVVSGGGSGTGINEVTAGIVNLGMSSRDLRAEEAAVLNPYRVAYDAIAIIVHPNNPVSNLSMDQAKKIFTGEISNWNEVGGNNAPILVQTRETGSGTLSVLQDLLLGSGSSVVDRATAHSSAALMKNAVARDANAIGFDSIGFVDSTVKALRLENIAASAQTVNNDTYPLSRSLWICTRGKAQPGPSAVFIDYLRSLEVQRDIVQREGYIRLPTT